MGNSLCKSNRSSNSPRKPFENFSISCPNIFTTSKNKPPYWKKQIITSRPPYFDKTTQSNDKNYQNAPTLMSTQPLTMTQKTIREAPIPPPRRKRTLATQTSVTAIPKNGFKEVFGSIQVEPATSQHHVSRSVSESSDGSARSKQSKLKVGNKKTDKFFGENLSDCLSDAPPPEVDASSASSRINNNSPIDHMNVDKKAAFLMTMLDTYHKDTSAATAATTNDDEKYKDKEPVTEPECVKVRRVRKHICDGFHDDDHHETPEGGHHHSHGPKKPQRDIELYRRSIPKTPSPPIRRKRSLKAAESETELVSIDVPEGPVKVDESQQPKQEKKESRDLLEVYNKMMEEQERVRKEQQEPKKTEEVVAKPEEHSKQDKISTEDTSTEEHENLHEKLESLDFLDSPLHPLKLNLRSPNHQRKDFERPQIRQKLSMPVLQSQVSNNSDDMKNESVSPVPQSPSTEVPRCKLTEEQLEKRQNHKKLQKSMSTSSFLSTELMEALIKRNYGFEPGFIDEFGYKDDDGSANVAKNITKLSTRKISTAQSQRSIPESPSTENLADEKVETKEQEKVDEKPLNEKSEEPKLNENKAEVKEQTPTIVIEAPFEETEVEANKNVKAEETSEFVIQVENKENAKYEDLPETEIKKPETVESPKEKVKQTEEETVRKTAPVPPTKPPRRSSVKTAEIDAALSSSGVQKVNDIMSDIYSNQREIVQEFQKFLEEELAKSPGLIEIYKNDAELERDVREVLKRTEQELAKANLMKDDDETSISTTSVPTPAVEVKEDHVKEEPVTSMHSMPVIVGLQDDSDTEITVGALPRAPGITKERTESINDTEPWFLQHYDIPTIEIPKEAVMMESPVTNYDHKKLFPFGDIMKRHDSLTDEFFDGKPLIDLKRIKLAQEQGKIDSGDSSSGDENDDNVVGSRAENKHNETASEEKK